MKPEIYAGILLLLIIAAAVINLCCLTDIANGITDLADQAGRAAALSQWDEANSYAQDAMSLWTRYANYTQTVLRQSEYDRAADALGRLLAAIYNREAGTAKGSADQVIETFQYLLNSERPTIPSIF